MKDIKSPVGEGRNTYTYAADGRKLKVIQQWNSNYSTSPVIGSTITVSALNQTKTTEYAGNMIYENGALKRILIDGGYIEGGVYYYYLRDHLGNNRVVANASGTVIQRNHYYPFGMAFAETSTTEQGLQPYKYNDKELDRMHGLNLYDYEARYMEPALGRFTTMDPLAEKYYGMTPYGYCHNNPVNRIDPTGMADFWHNGKVIGNDGVDDQKIYVLKTTEKSFGNSDEGSLVTGAGLSKDDLKTTVKFIETNSGKAEAFQNNGVAYTNSVAIESSAETRQGMVNEVSRDNGKGGTGEANNREYGGSVRNGVVTAAEPGQVSSLGNNASIMLPVGPSTFHSHPSGESSTNSASAGMLSTGSVSSFGETVTPRGYTQSPSPADIQNAGNRTNYVFGRSNGNVYIYNSNGVQAVIPMKYFVTPKDNMK